MGCPLTTDRLSVGEVKTAVVVAEATKGCGFCMQEVVSCMHEQVAESG